MNKDDMSDDAEFDAFLNGQGDLARRMQGLAQPEPSAALDAAILANARSAMAQEARPVAANDSGDSTPAPRLEAGLSRRWRIPAAIAATVLVGVVANQTFQSAGELNEVVVPAPTSSNVFTAPVQESTSEPAVVMQDRASEPARTMPSAPKQQLPTPANRAVAKPAPAVPVVPESAAPAASEAHDPIPAPAPAPAPERLQNRTMRAKPGAPSPAPVVADSASPVAAPAAPPASAPAAAPAPVANREGGRSSLEHDAAKAPFALSSDPPPVVALTPPASVWLHRIEKLLEQGGKTKAIEQWMAFRAAYPDYPVPAATREKLEQISTRR